MEIAGAVPGEVTIANANVVGPPDPPKSEEQQMFASGAIVVISITSAGHILPIAEPPCFVLIDRVLRDGGTSLHYQPLGTWNRSQLADRLKEPVLCARQDLEPPALAGTPWTTDAPYGVKVSGGCSRQTMNRRYRSRTRCRGAEHEATRARCCGSRRAEYVRGRPGRPHVVRRRSA